MNCLGSSEYMTVFSSFTPANFFNMLHFIADFARGIIGLPRFNCEDLEEIVAGGQGSFGVYW